MKRFLCILIALIFVLSSIQISYGDTFGAYFGGDIIQTANFIDIGGIDSKDDILKLRLLGIISGSGSKYFYPNNKLTRQEAMAYLIRLIDKEDEARTKMTKTPEFLCDSWAVGYIFEGIDNGIITKEELSDMAKLSMAQINAIEAEIASAQKSNWKMTAAEKTALKDKRTKELTLSNKSMKKYIQKEELALWLARAYGIEGELLGGINKVYKYSDWYDINSDYLPFIEGVIKLGIMDEGILFSPKSNITRKEAAKIFKEALEIFPNKLGVSFLYGKINSINIEPNTAGDINKYNTTYQIEAYDGKKNSISVNYVEVLPVIKDGRVYQSSILKPGDTIEYAIKDGKTVYARLGETSFTKGTLNYVGSEGVLRIEDFDGNISEINLNDDTIVSVLGEKADKKALIVGQIVSALYKSGNAVYIDIKEPMNNTYNAISLEGIIKYIDKDTNLIKLEDFDGNMRTFALSDSVEVTINSFTEDIGDLSSEMEAVFEIIGRRVTAINAYTIKAGDDSQKSFTQSGRVRKIDKDSIVISPSNDEKKEIQYGVDYLTMVNKMGSIKRIEDIKVGDGVIITGTKGNLSRADKISVVSCRSRVDNVYKARLLNVIPTESKIALKDVYQFKYSDWVKTDEGKTIDLGQDAKLYQNGQKIGLSELDTQIGREIYIVTTKEFGNEEVIKLLTKWGSEDHIYSNTLDVGFTDSIVKLDNGDTLKFDESTIVLKDRRLLDNFDLLYSDEVFAVKNSAKDSNSVAALLSLENVNAFESKNIVKGYIHDMGEDYFTLEGYSSLINNEWDYDYDGEQSFYVSRDIKIFDSVITHGSITKETFLQSRYRPYTYTIHDPKDHENENHEHNYKHNTTHTHSHMIGYAVVTEDNEVIALNIAKRDNKLGEETKSHTEILLTGEVADIQSTYYQMKLTEVREFSNFYQKWQTVKSDMTLNLSSALIIKDDRTISIDELMMGDSVYMISDSNNGIIVFVE